MKDYPLVFHIAFECATNDEISYFSELLQGNLFNINIWSEHKLIYTLCLVPSQKKICIFHKSVQHMKNEQFVILKLRLLESDTNQDKETFEARRDNLEVIINWPPKTECTRQKLLAYITQRKHGTFELN